MKNIAETESYAVAFLVIGVLQRLVVKPSDFIFFVVGS